MDGTVLDAAREDIVAASRARHQLLVRVRELHDADAAATTGYRSTKRLIAQLWNLDAGEAARLVADAEVLVAQTSFTGEPVAPVLPATAGAAASGALGEQHVRVI